MWCVEIRRDATAKRNVIIQFSLVIVRTYRGMVPWYHVAPLGIIVMLYEFRAYNFFSIRFFLPRTHTSFFSRYFPKREVVKDEHKYR